jgi:4-amino-4-deoxy-L-arabinose transferase-like glycosyltransferase
VSEQRGQTVAWRGMSEEAAGAIRARQARRLDIWALAVILLGALAYMALSLGRFSTEYDEGVYWQSLRAMARGHALYSSIFSSQPPFFLLGVYPGYLLLGQSLLAARAVIAVYALTGIVAIYVIGWALGGRWVGVAAAGLLAVNPRYLQEATTLQAEIPSLTLALVGIALVAIAMRPVSRRGVRLALVAIAGVALGLAIMTKLLAVVALVPAALLLAAPLFAGLRLSRAGTPLLSVTVTQQELRAVARDLGLLIAGVIAACVAVLAPFLPQWGALYEQVVGFHLVARGSSGGSPLTNLAFLPDITWILALLGLAVALYWRIWMTLPLLAWLLAGVLVLALQRPLFDAHVLTLAPPLALLGALGSVAAIDQLRARYDIRPRGMLLAGGTVVALAATLLAGLWLDARQIRAAETYTGGARAQMVQTLRDHAIPSGPVVTDDQYVAALAGRDTPPELVDTSLVRIATGSLTTDQVERMIQRDDARVVLFASGRFDHLPGLRAWVEANFHPSATFDPGQTLYVRQAPLSASVDLGS